jgi:hypothetical protein
LSEQDRDSTERECPTPTDNEKPGAGRGVVKHGHGSRRQGEPHDTGVETNRGISAPSERDGKSVPVHYSHPETPSAVFRISVESVRTNVYRFFGRIEQKRLGLGRSVPSVNHGACDVVCGPSPAGLHLGVWCLDVADSTGLQAERNG